MSLRVLLEEFRVPEGGGPTQTAAAGHMPEADIEAIKSAAYETGYASGWEDAGKASTDQKTRVDAEFERCIQDLGFTFHEAVAQLRGEMGVLMQAVAEQFFPEILPDLLRATVREEILKLAEGALHPAIELVASPDTVDNFDNMLPAKNQIEIRVLAEPSLGPNQAFLRFEDQEIAADFEPLLKTLKAQLAAFIQTAEPEAEHG